MKSLPQTPSFRLDGRRALVTGAGRGIGEAAAVALATAGAHVTLAARTGDELDVLCGSLRALGLSADTMVLDVLDVEQACQKIRSSEPFDILVNNAGTNRPMPMIAVTADDFDAVMGLNVRAAFFVVQAVAKRLMEGNRPGSIINMSSQMGHVGGARRSIYCASKWAIEGFSRAAAVEFAPHGVRVNTLCPTFIETPMTRRLFEDSDFKADVLSRIKLGRMGTVEDLMGAIVFLASDASALMTGSSLIVDGGWTAD
ncbi:SDR family NAD(P)-dependent oxidoreductase [Bradyrhizobium canariense]|uniref:SDR family NAD(P)-dependent oxidoreductase n=1 Tax=Bradyrhizobium canariense TaxID=255045 RepID=UPI000A195EBF|nr:SDR family NAD(P)-dependent oxidoreductase [Bradyrhizobium canariense]OSI28368.1 3-oxoacyl-ACP reductase [Bradyrhizobium canariense]OSI33917.1 3-oxoacyl-ACP reductase [Bradyrhizobium canariense]OSI45597.1 3-oxoacyl-ACP reductase [Bradyrhizobium canariense]OSI53004.1 3-oxoacyl-ACP reductase [Bradyrhizobium canariense]OSI56102.1 3-oxoacyl-ACP reductase [Bradyrhizobium canariense]